MVTYLLAQIQETLGSYFKDYFYTYSHDASVGAVAQGSADGAAVDSLKGKLGFLNIGISRKQGVEAINKTINKISGV